MTPSWRSHAGGPIRQEPELNQPGFAERHAQGAQVLPDAECTFQRLGEAPSRTPSVAHQPGVATMKSINLRIFGGLLVLGAAWLIVPGVPADDATDHANQLAQAQQ